MSNDLITARAFIAELREENRAFYSSDRGRGALRDFQQTFPHHWLYVGELLQNAVDAGARKIRLSLASDDTMLVVEHDGAAFSADDVKALCTRGLSKKGAGTVGFMGIGFKAVFQSFECVDVASGPWRFRFCVKEEVGEYGDRQRDWLGCVLPQDAENITAPSSGMTCRFVLHERLARRGPITDDVATVLSMDVLALLARRGVQELDWHGQRWLLSQTSSVVNERTTRVVLEALDEATQAVRQWALFSARYQPSHEAIARFLEHRQIRPLADERERVYAEARRERAVEAFCELDEAGIPSPPKHARAYALLGTGVAVPIGLHVQADWLLNTSRRELMEVEANAWHQEILAQLPGLLRAYLHWVTQLANIPQQRLTESYAVLPQWGQPDGTFATVTASPAFRDAIRDALQDLDFLPVRRADGTRFVTPQEARLLPSALRGFDDARLLPWSLFGGDILSTSLLGTAGLASLQPLAFLTELTPNELLGRWSSGEVGQWREALGDRAIEMHLRLLQALATLDADVHWRDARLCCLPATDGSWIDRHAAMGLPADWDSVPDKDPALREWLEPFVAPVSSRIEWTFDRALLRDQVARQYIANTRRQTTDDVLATWWKAQPAQPDEETCQRVLDVTCWVHGKRRTQAALVTRVLCDTSGGQVLVALADAVLADPYASSARRRFFPKQPVVTDRYAKQAGNFTDADWRSFFENASRALRGPLRLRDDARVLSKEQLAQALPSFAMPATKSRPIPVNRRGMSFSSQNYLLVDPQFPEELHALFASPLVRRDAQAIGLWLQEARQGLAQKPLIRVEYVPYNSSSLSYQRTSTPASWVNDLRNTAWLYATDGGGPFLPAQVLASPDPARPDASVADLPEDLAATLSSCGIAFGTSIPEVASLDRLQREGPSAPVERVLELVQQALNDTSDDADKRASLHDILRTSPLLPCSSASIPIDGASRVGAGRLVQRSARGADLGGWLIAVDTLTSGLRADDAYARLLALIASELSVPDAPTWEQALAFLTWVWRARPDAELVRRILPRAYRIITEERDDAQQQEWENARPSAMVYAASRKWVSVESDDLFLDDLGDDRLKGVVRTLSLATPGHLGETAEEQRRAATLLELRLLSTRFQISLHVTREQNIPQAWLAGLRAIVDIVRSAAREDQPSDARVLTTLPIAHCARLRKELLDNGLATAEWRVQAAQTDNRIIVASDPDDFAADLCRVLLQWAGLAGRRDLDDLAPTITQLIGWLNRPDKFERRLAEVRATREPATTPPKTPSEPPTPPPADAAPTEPQQPPAPSHENEEEQDTEEKPGPNEPSPKPDEQPAEEPGLSGGYTPEDRESRLRSLQKKKDEISAQMESLLGVGPVPDEPTQEPRDDAPSRPFASDVAYREAAIAYELQAGRYAEAKDAKQPGYDVDSFDKPLDDPERRLVRRIEVKGHGCPWENEDTVELSGRQFHDAFAKNIDGISVAEDFDYWLYVVERREEEGLCVLPIKNPARRAAKFEFRGGTWRALAEKQDGA